MSSHPSTDPAGAELFADPGGRAAVAAALAATPEELSYRALERGVTHDTLIVSVGERPAGVLRLAPARPEVLPRLQPFEEGALFELLEGSGLPAPRALIVDREGGELGTPGLLMSYCEGANTLTWERMEERGGAGAVEDAFGTIVRMHSMPVPAGWPERHEPGTHRERELAGTRRLLEEAGEGAPHSLRRLLPELEGRPPEPTAVTGIVHGDFRPANMMAAGGRVTGILDWEMATTGDPLCDFGVSTMREWGVWMPDEELLARYGAARGVECDPVALRWWRAVGYAKVVAFVAARQADGWVGPDIGRWVDGLERAVAEWSD